MKATIRPSKIKGTIHAPASKSSMQRACAAALLRKGTSSIFNPGHSNDDKAALNIIKTLGATVQQKDDAIIINSEGVTSGQVMHCGESGLSVRMFTPIAALSENEIEITGEGSLLSRPLEQFDEILPQLDVKLTSNQGKLPLKIHGPLVPRDIEIDGSLSSQFLTGLLMTYGGANASNVSISVKNLKSRPYIDLTLDVMKQFGLKVPENNNYETFYYPGENKMEKKEAVEYTVEGDWSGAAFLLVAGAIAGPVLIHGLDLSSTQADRKIVDALMSANAAIAMEAKGIRIQPAKMDGFYFDATDCPDLFPPLVALAAYCQGQTSIKGVSRLIHKESNRALALQDEFDAMGVVIEMEEDIMLIEGNGKVKGADVHSHHDHRIAMACAVAGLGADSEMIIDDAQAVNKSYPGFFEDLKSLNADVSLDNSFKYHE